MSDKSKVRKAVFPAAGLGTRFLPATKAMPKEMLPLVDKPLIQYGVEEAVQSDIHKIIIVTGAARRRWKITSITALNWNTRWKPAARKNYWRPRAMRRISRM